MQAQQTNNRTKNRLLILAMAGAFILPVLLSAILVNTQHDWMSWNRRNQGTLVHPARPLTAFTLQTRQGQAFDLNTLQGKWNVVMFGDGTCNQACQEELYNTRQTRLAQDKEMLRVRRLYILNGESMSAEMQQLVSQQHPDLVVLQSNAAEYAAFSRQFELQGQFVPQRVYLVDPHGNLMMYYEPGFPPKGLLEDLKRLLRVSQIG